MRKKFLFLGFALVGLLAAALLTACGDATSNPVSQRTSLPPAATSTPTPKPLPEAWYKFPEKGYKNATFSGQNGELLKQLAENSTRYSSVRISSQGGGQVESQVKAALVIPQNGTIWFDLELNYTMAGNPAYGRIVNLEEGCFKNEGKGWTKEDPQYCKDSLWIAEELHPLMSILAGPPDNPEADPATFPALQINLLPDENLDGQQVGVLTLSTPQSSNTTVRYDKATSRLLQFKEENGLDIRFSNYDDPGIKITSPLVEK